MKRGTKSVLFGVHQFLWHPLTVGYAWRALYRRWPNWWEWVAIFAHDLGYVGCPDMDGPIGQLHPVAGSELAERWVRNLAALGFILRSPIRAALDGSYGDESSTRAYNLGIKARALCLGHSKSFCKLGGVQLSPLYLADKACVLFDPKWFYLFRGVLSGEVFEYRDASPVSDCSLSYWFDWYCRKTQDLICKTMPETFELAFVFPDGRVVPKKEFDR